MRTETLLEARERLELTQRQVATAVGVTAAAVRFWEQGVCRPNRRNRRKLAILLGWRSENTVDMATLDRVRPASGDSGKWNRERIVALWKLARCVRSGGVGLV